MVASEHLNQMEFPGMPRRMEVASPSAETQTSWTDDDIPYRDNDAHRAFRWGRAEEPLSAANPLYDPGVFDAFSGHVDREVSEGKFGTEESEEFIPPWRVRSSQGSVNPDAIDHQVRNADPMALREDPEVNPIDEGGVESYFVTEGNHRTLAAQRRGQLLMPANVRRMV